MHSMGKSNLATDHTNARAVSPDDLNVITIQLNWGNSRPLAKTRVSKIDLPSDGLIPEEKVQKGNLSSAGLGRLVHRKDCPTWGFRVDKKISPLIFFFHHGSAGG